MPEDKVWVPGKDALGGRWTIGLPPSPWQRLPPLRADAGVTALSGQVLRVDGWPLAGVKLTLDERLTRTDDAGRFLLADVPAGRQTLVVDARPASTTKTPYGFFMIAVDVRAQETTVLPYTVFMPVIDVAHAIPLSIPTTQEVVATTPLIPGLEAHIPPNTILRKPDGTLATEITITPIPIDRPPFPLPLGAEIPVYFTLQPGGAIAESADGGPHPGISLVFPNYAAIPPESAVKYWSYDAADRGWFKYGFGRVSATATRIVPDPGVTIDRLTCASMGSDGGGAGGCPSCCNSAGDPVELSTGIFVHQERDLYIADIIPIDLRRDYRTDDTVARAFGLGATHSYDMFLFATNFSLNGCAEVALTLTDEGGARVTFQQSGGGTSCTSPNPFSPHTTSSGQFYGATLTRVSNRDPGNAEGYQGRPGWDVRLTDGTVYEFTNFNFSSRTPLTAVQDRYGNRLRIERELPDQFYFAGAARAKKITSPNGRWIEFTYTPGAGVTTGRVKQIRDNTGRTVDYTYDSTARLTSVRRPDPTGSRTPYETTYTYVGTSANMESVRGARLNLTLQYWPDGSVKKEILGDGVSAWQFTYNFPGGFGISRSTQTDVTDPRGFVRRVTFNSDGYKTGETLALGVEPEQQISTFTRAPGTSLLQFSTDALGRRTDYTYDAAGHVETITRLAGTPDAVTTTLAYDPTFGQLSSIKDPLIHETKLIYRPNGTLETLTDPTNKVWTFGANAAGQVTSITDPLGKTTQFGFLGGDLVTLTDATQKVTTRTVDALGRVRRVTDPVGQGTAYDYDTLDQLTGVTDPLGGQTHFSYDPAGNLRTVTDARQRVTTYEYDAMNRLARRADPLGRAETFDYDPVGNLVIWTDRKAQITSYGYDGLSRRTSTLFLQSDGALESLQSALYDDGDRQTALLDSNQGTIIRSYDGLDRLREETGPAGMVTYTYDVAGRRDRMTLAGPPATLYTYGFDPADRLTQITQGTTMVQLTYDDVGRRKTLTLPNGIVVTTGYDDAGRVTGLTGVTATTTVLDLTYGYDAAGNRTSVGGASRRTSVPGAVAAASYDPANQLQQWGGVVQTYDANGNLATDGPTTYTWNVRNELVGVTGPGLTASFAYDAFGRRTSRTINGGTPTSFQWDGFNRVKTVQGATTSLMLAGLGLDEHFARLDSAAVTSFLTDALGSTYTLTDGTGAVTAQYRYEPYGATTKTSGAATTDLLFTGREEDGTGMQYFRARYYAPRLARFAAPDPLLVGSGSVYAVRPLSFSLVGGFHGLHAYAYANLSPAMLADPFGLCASCDAEWEQCRTNQRSDVQQCEPTCRWGCYRAFTGPALEGCLWACPGRCNVIDKLYTQFCWGRYVGCLINNFCTCP